MLGQKFIKFLPCFFWKIEDTKKSFWDQMTFSRNQDLNSNFGIKTKQQLDHWSSKLILTKVQFLISGQKCIYAWMHILKSKSCMKPNLGTIQILRNHWTGWVGWENRHFFLLSVHRGWWGQKKSKNLLT